MKSAASRSATALNAKKKSTLKISKTISSAANKPRSKVAVNPQHPEAEIKHIVRGIVWQGLQVIPPKSSISLRVDADVLAWFKAQGEGYQTRINSVLKAFRDASI
jgi:uncharacterized protein (DUF4415 family)